MADHYYSENQNSRERVTSFKETILGKTLVFESSSGTFSPKKVDKGSLVLINNCEINGNERILDLGCGYGPVGISLAKAYDVDVVMTDINKRAVRFAKKNARVNNIDNVVIKQGDGFEKIEGKFDSILLNPPQSAGKELCLNLIRQSKEYLKEGGRLQIVARKNKGGKVLSEFMEEAFGNLRVLSKTAGYWVYSSTRFQ